MRKGSHAAQNGVIIRHWVGGVGGEPEIELFGMTFRGPGNLTIPWQPYIERNVFFEFSNVLPS